jgi:hypothetical protein
VKVLLDDDVAAACEGRIFAANEDGVCRRIACGILGAIDKSEDIPFVEVTKTLDLIGSAYGAAETSHNLRGQLKTQIHLLGANVKDQIACGGDSMARA